MKKRIVAALAASLALMTLASTAGATITITQAPGGQPSPGYYKNLSPWTLTPGTACGGNGGTYASTDRIRLGFGWLASNRAGVREFFLDTHGYVQITGSDTFNDTWARSGTPFVTTQGIKWTVEDGLPGVTPGGAPITGSAAFYRGVLSLAPGQYTLSVGMLVDKTFTDGWETYTAGTSSLSNTCTFTVS